MVYDEAKSLVQKALNELSRYDGIEYEILDDETIEKPWGWVFFYQSRQYLETGNFKDLLTGNAPYIVNRNSGEVVVTGTSEPIDVYIQKYEQGLTNDT